MLFINRKRLDWDEVTLEKLIGNQFIVELFFHIQTWV
jgi:hypothetical protein